MMDRSLPLTTKDLSVQLIDVRWPDEFVWRVTARYLADLPREVYFPVFTCVSQSSEEQTMLASWSLWRTCSAANNYSR